MSVKRLRILAALLAGVFGAPLLARAACTVPGPICDASTLLANPQCCGGTNCTLTPTITLTGPSCTLDFGTRNVTLSGKLVVGTTTAVVRAANFTLVGEIDARGTASVKGGSVTFDVADFTMDAGGAEIDATGPTSGGGAVTVFAGGNVSLLRGTILAEGTLGGAPAGTIRIESDGDIRVVILINASGKSPPLLGMDSIRLKSAGSTMLEDDGKLIATTGSVSIAAEGAVTLEQPSLIESNEGGLIDVEGASIDARGLLTAVPGSAISLVATAGDIFMQRTGTLLTTTGAPSVSFVTESATPSGNITIDAPIDAFSADMSIEAQGSITILARIDFHGSIEEGPGGLEVIAFGDVDITGAILGTSADSGGSFDISAERDVHIGANVEMRGNADGFGGEVTVDARRDILVDGTAVIDVAGADSGDGGAIDMNSGRDFIVGSAATLRAPGGGTGGSGGEIALGAGVDITSGRFPGDLTIHGKVLVNGHGTGPSRISLAGCDVLVSATGEIDATGDTFSTNDVTGRTSLTIAGTIVAVSNHATHLTGLPPVITGTVTPAFAASPVCTLLHGTVTATGCQRPICTAPNTPQGCLIPCPNCGDGIVDAPFEECDPGVQDRCVAECTFNCQDDPCSAGSACLVPGCDLLGGCYFTTLPNGTACDDATVCNGHEMCLNSACLAGTPLTCNDGNPCTTDCHPTLGCSSTPISGTGITGCDDGNACTGAENCNAGACESGTPVDCPDGPPPEVCNASNGTCQPLPCTLDSECDDSNPCTSDQCVTSFCTNTMLPNDTPCTNSTVCDGAETCQGGACTLGTPLDCDDGLFCTITDACDAIGGCTHSAPPPGCCEDADDCDDANVCSTDTCTGAHVCNNAPMANCCTGDPDCDDQNPCTQDSACVSNLCTNTPLMGSQPGCGDACEPATCAAGICEASAPTVCDADTDPCTDDFCDTTLGCVHPAIANCCVTQPDARCDDDDACTTDTCDTTSQQCDHVREDETCTVCDAQDVFACSAQGLCAADQCIGGRCQTTTTPDCVDTNPCTSDTCSPATGCANAPITGPTAGCGDGLTCTGTETCDAGTCVDPPDLDCDDDDLCTDDACTEPAGCTHTSKTGFASVTCEIDGVAACLATPEAAAIDSKRRAALEKKLAKAEAQLAKAVAAAEGPKAVKALKKTEKKLNALRKYVTKQRTRLPDVVATCLLDTVDQTKAASVAQRAVLGV